ncbi:Maf family protein [Ornithinibacillus scapharcae]|uniref:Maf family protein n=1 Tax=Ornithinibacillus scapharcae TaxID=1147159 RepID=UPI000225AD53|nr:Maf family protein [Ornithinibacillus scapharcae]
MNKLVLASTSPRRRELLEQIHIPFTIRKQTFDESVVQTQDPSKKAEQLALLKAKHTELLEPDEIILTADTIVAYNSKIFEKPRDEQEAFMMLSNLSGNTHDVYTGVSIRSDTNQVSFVEKTSVEFWTLTAEEIYDYIKTKDPFDKAGAYGIQGHGAVLVKRIIGDYFNVVGLPISRVMRELKQFHIIGDSKG